MSTPVKHALQWLGRLLLVTALTSPFAAVVAAAGATPPPGANAVRIDNFSFSPQTLTVAAGTTVTWVNYDDSPHTVTSDANPHLFNSPAMDTDDKFSHTFTTPGTYKYFCAIHPHMVGVVVVK
ncbi:Amicyanin-alpha [Pandoraea terrae]|uniref:Amicyanin-alpha n=1 Tax=Pandoraea terrae TaxID=1537710 RepID=A0A5E4S2Y1_9BURK|nr:cupredoxin family copper-binding protein [Pandoraea terrae]VVD68448.1 Amicyanin-alpha [Pandoraea terrae]